MGGGTIQAEKKRDSPFARDRSRFISVVEDDGLELVLQAATGDTSL